MKASKPILLIIAGSILLLLHFVSFHLFNHHYLTVGLMVIGVGLVAYGVFLSKMKKSSISKT